MTTTPTNWYAINSPRPADAERDLAPYCQGTYHPVETIVTSNGAHRTHSIIPRVLFIRTDHDNAVELETRARNAADPITPFWIYRYHRDGDIQPIPDRQIAVLRLLTATDTTKCEIYRRTDYTVGQRVRITAGRFEGLTGHIRRVRRNRHVIVAIEGICAVMLPYIHPDLIEPAE